MSLSLSPIPLFDYAYPHRRERFTKKLPVHARARIVRHKGSTNKTITRRNMLLPAISPPRPGNPDSSVGASACTCRGSASVGAKRDRPGFEPFSNAANGTRTHEISQNNLFLHQIAVGPASCCPLPRRSRCSLRARRSFVQAHARNHVNSSRVRLRRQWHAPRPTHTIRCGFAARAARNRRLRIGSRRESKSRKRTSQKQILFRRELPALQPGGAGALLRGISHERTLVPSRAYL